MRIYEFKRQKRVEEISAFIKESQLKGETITRKDWISAIMSKYNVSRKTALEYFDTASYKNEHS